VAAASQYPLQGDGDLVEFKQTDALLVIDVLDDFNHEDAEQLFASFRARGAGMASAIDAAREAGVPVIYVKTTETAGIAMRRR
jgi:nicotinamidase-related amidase